MEDLKSEYDVANSYAPTVFIDQTSDMSSPNLLNKKKYNRNNLPKLSSFKQAESFVEYSQTFEHNRQTEDI